MQVDVGHLFYRKGLVFECKRCSNCCRHDPGYVFLSEKDLVNFRKKTKLSEDEFVRKFCRVVDINGFKRLSLKEKENFDCIFWEETGCRMYSSRPLQCRSFPFWSVVVFSKGNWEYAGKSCPGINNGKLVNKKKIEYWLDRRKKEPLIVINAGYSMKAD